MNGIGGLLNTVSFGGFNKLFGIGGNAREVQAAIDLSLIHISLQQMFGLVTQFQNVYSAV